MGTMLEAAHTCNSQDKNGWNAPAGLMQWSGTDIPHPTSGVTGAACLGFFRFLSPVRNAIWAQCKHWQGLIQAAQMSSSQGSPWATKQALPTSEPCLSPAMLWGAKECPCYMHNAVEGLTARPWLGQLLLSLLSQVSVVTPFLPPPLPNTGFHLAGATENRE